MSDKLLTGFYSEAISLMEEGMEAEDAVASLLKRKEFMPNIVKLLAGQLRAQYRATTSRPAEQEAATALVSGNVESARSQLLGHSFALPNGKFVPWVEATADEHRARSMWQRNRARSITQDATLHEFAAQLIEEAGVRNLGEIKSIDRHPELAAAMKGELTATN